MTTYQLLKRFVVKKGVLLFELRNEVTEKQWQELVDLWKEQGLGK